MKKTKLIIQREKTSVEKIHCEINKLHVQLKYLYTAEIKKLQRDINVLNNQLTANRQRQNQLLQKKTSLIQTISSSIKKKNNFLPENQNSIHALGRIIKSQSEELKYLKQLLNKQKEGLDKYTKEKQALISINQKNQNYVDFKRISEQPQPPASMRNSHNVSMPNLVDHLSIIQLSRPPIPTDGPDQLQIEAEFNAIVSKRRQFNPAAPAHDHPNSSLLSAFNNYLADDDLDEESDF